jgi:hypothetical protein
MRFDARADPAVVKRLQVVDLTTGRAIEDVAWADDEIGAYATFRRSGPGNDIERDATGDPVLVEHAPGSGAIRIIGIHRKMS